MPAFLALILAFVLAPVSLSAQSQATISVGAHIVSSTGFVDAFKLASAAVRDSVPGQSVWSRTVGAASVTTRIVPPAPITDGKAPRPVEAVVTIEYTAN